PAASHRPSGETATHSTSPVWASVARALQLAASHSLTLPGLPQSPPQLTRVLPSGVKHTDQASPSCPSRLATSLPVGTSHTLIAPNRTPAASVLPSGDRETPRTSRASASRNALTGLCVVTSHRRAVPSELPDAIRAPSALKASAFTQVLWPL